MSLFGERCVYSGAMCGDACAPNGQSPFVFSLEVSHFQAVSFPSLHHAGLTYALTPLRLSILADCEANDDEP